MGFWVFWDAVFRKQYFTRIVCDILFLWKYLGFAPRNFASFLAQWLRLATFSEVHRFTWGLQLHGLDTFALNGGWLDHLAEIQAVFVDGAETP